MAKSLFDQLDMLFSELIPLPEAVKAELAKEVQPELDKMWKEKQVKPMRPVKPQQNVDAELITIPPSEEKKNHKKIESTQQDKLVVHQVDKRATPTKKQIRKQRLRTAQELREAIVMSEILAPPVALRKK